MGCWFGKLRLAFALGMQVGTYLVVKLNSLDDLFIGIEQGANISFVLDELNVSNDSSSGNFGLVEVILNFGTLGQTLVLSVDVLSSQLLNIECTISLPCRS